MTQQPVGSAHVPQWDVADRMRKALRTSGVGVQEMADYLGVARNSVGNWINGRIPPSVQTLRLWALKTGVSLEWLETGLPAPVTSGEAAPRDLPHRRRTPATAGRPDLGKPVNERYLPAIIHGSERRSSRDDWRIRELRGSHELPILARRHGQTLRICRSVAA